MEREYWLTTADQCKLYIKSWGTTLPNPKAVLFISHGMTEHIGRYEHVAAFYNQQGFIVYGDDHRGHGKTGEKQGQLGYIADKNGFYLMVEDVHFILQHIKSEHPNLPIFVLGHSMGSFIVRNYIQNYSHVVSGAVLSGSGYFPEKASKSGLQIASLQDPKKESKFMNQIVFGSYNNKVLDRLTSFDWLTRDEEIVAQYVKDPLSGYVPTAGFFVDLLTGILTMQDNKKNQQIRKDLPLLFVSGDKDPVGNYSKGVFQAAESYSKVGLENVLVALFPDARHELHNEINKEEVFSFVDTWLSQQLHQA